MVIWPRLRTLVSAPGVQLGVSGVWGRALCLGSVLQRGGSPVTWSQPPLPVCRDGRVWPAGNPRVALVLVLLPRSWAQGSQVRKRLFICEAFSLFHERGVSSYLRDWTQHSLLSETAGAPEVKQTFLMVSGAETTASLS